MIGSYFEHQAVATPYAIPIGAVTGAVLGYIHFKTLKWNTDLFADGNIWKALAVQILRLMLMSAVLVFLAMLGAWMLLSALASLLIARAIIMRREVQIE